MNSIRYVSLLNINNNSGSNVLFSTSQGAETAGSVARGLYSYGQGAETAGSVASSSTGGSSCSTSSCGGSFSAVA